MPRLSPSRFPIPLAETRQGSAEAKAEFFLIFYQDLRRLAQSHLKHERPDHTLQATALVHEVYLRLAGEEGITWQERADFMMVAARLMRRILIDYARTSRAAKRNGGRRAVPIEEAVLIPSMAHGELIELNEALQLFEKLHPRAARIVELRYFGGLTEEEAAKVLGISVTTIKREWNFAKAWLFDQLGD